jgi:hypothetical protein
MRTITGLVVLGADSWWGLLGYMHCIVMGLPNRSSSLSTTGVTMNEHFENPDLRLESSPAMPSVLRLYGAESAVLLDAHRH